MSNNEENLQTFLRGPEWFQRFAKGNAESQWQPIPSFSWTVGFYLCITIIALPVGGGMFFSTKHNTSFGYRYDNFEPGLNNEERLELIRAPSGYGSSVLFEMDKKMHAPVYVYYELRDYYQNHKRYVRSLNERQLGGANPGSGSLDACDPYRDAPRTGENADSSSEEDVIVPCGLIAHSYFNDTFELVSSEDQAGTDLTLVMDESGIATEWDRKYLYGDRPAENFNELIAFRGGAQITGNLSNDEHFMVWMRVGSKPSIRKLYGIIHDDIPKGAKLTFDITNNYNTYDFNGQKRLILSTSNWTGGRNEITGIVYFVIGTFSAIACIFILFMDLRSDRTQGDLQALSWNRNRNQE